MVKKAAQAAVKPTAAELSAQLSDMLNQHAREERGDVDVDKNIPQKKIAGGKSTWKGAMILPNNSGGVLAKFNVNTCTAVDDETFHRHMYHSADCPNLVKQGAMTCTGCGEELQKNMTVKGVEADGKVILISDEELAKLVPQNEKTMRVLEYIQATDMDPVYFEDTEFLYPEKNNVNSAFTFGALAAVLRCDGTVAKGVRVKRGKEQYFVVRPYGQYGLSINLLRAEYEVRDTQGLWSPVAVPSEVVKMFATVKESLKKPFTAAKRDQYLANATALKEAKRAGKDVNYPTPEPETAAVDDLWAALKAATAAAGK